MTDGSTENYTSKVTWRLFGGASITSQGVATFPVAGQFFVSAQYSSAYSTLTVLVLPPGTFRLSGSVFESGLALGGATVKVTAGGGAGLSTLTDDYGYYSLFGVAGAIEVEVTKAGYVRIAKSITVTSNTQDLSFREVTQEAPVPSMSGSYTLTLTSADDCSSYRGAPPPLPAEDRTRSYSAVVTQTGPSLTVTLGGARFAKDDNIFIGRLEPNRLTFQIFSGYYDPDYTIIEQLDGGGRLTFSGSVETVPSTMGVQASMSGFIAKYDLNGAQVAGCSSNRHQFRLMPVGGRARR
jgi:hypothetical protein